MKRLSLESAVSSISKKDADTVTETSQIKRRSFPFPGPSKSADRSKKQSADSELKDTDSDKIFAAQKKPVKETTTIEGKITIINQM